MKSEPVQIGPQPNQMAMMPVCKHEECRHPVYGESIPCEQARRELVFCRFEGRFWEKKEELDQSPVSLIVPK